MKKQQPQYTGDIKAFKKSWKKQPEINYIHWDRRGPQNQVQFAFFNHWQVFNKLMLDKQFNKGKRVLEVGSGRGSLSAHFSDNGYECSLLDISPEVIESAKNSFRKHHLKANFYVGDANTLPFVDGSFDITFSIGLLEHFEKPQTAIAEQIRILDKGGLFIGYIVPKYEHNVQDDYEWINQILKGYMKQANNMTVKEPLYRSDFGSSHYKPILKELGLKGIKASGIYSLPMISHSIEFPFSLMPLESEQALLQHYKKIMQNRSKRQKMHPWLCKEGHGNAFLIWGYKK